MNEFVNPQRRSIELPVGCKDLVDVLPPPREVRMPVEGFGHIERYLSRLSQSAAKRRSITIWSLDYKENVSIFHRNGNLKIMVLVDTKDIVREQAVLRFFREADISAVCDSDGREHGVPLRIFLYPLPKAVPDAAHLVRMVLKTVCGFTEDAGLIFVYREKDEA